MNESEQVMRHVLARIGLRASDPRRLFLTAALVAAIGLVTGYIEVAREADREMALRQGPPGPVALQDFAPRLHTGPADEVSVRAEADFSRAIVLSLHGAKPARRALVVPLFPLSALGRSLIEVRERAVTSSLTAQVNRRTDGAPRRPGALGLIFLPLAEGAAPPADPAGLAETIHGDGDWGTVVSLNGQAVEPGGYTLAAAGAFEAMDIGLASAFLAVRPFGEGRIAALSVPGAGTAHRFLFGLALALAFAGAALIIRPPQGPAVTAPGAVPVDDLHPAEVASDHPKFARIPSQREIQARERDVPPRPPHWAALASQVLLRWTVVVLAALGSVLAALGAAAFRAVRSRLSRQEDGAL